MSGLNSQSLQATFDFYLDSTLVEQIGEDSSFVNLTFSHREDCFLGFYMEPLEISPEGQAKDHFSKSIGLRLKFKFLFSSLDG